VSRVTIGRSDTVSSLVAIAVCRPGCARELRVRRLLSFAAMIFCRNRAWPVLPLFLLAVAAGGIA
jgi:hypothetical protein